jgi:hypothetical protein
MARWTILKKIGVGAGANHLANNIGVGCTRQNDDFGAERFAADAPNQFDAVELGQIEIDHRDVWMELPDLAHGRFAIRALRNHFKLRVSLEYGSEPIAAEGVFVSQQNRYFFRGGH